MPLPFPTASGEAAQIILHINEFRKKVWRLGGSFRTFIKYPESVLM